MHPNIVVSGEAGHGKDTIGNYLVERYGYVRAAFGDPIRVEMMAAYREAPLPVNLEFLNDRATKQVPDSRLALMHCSDQDFVMVALEAFKEEDGDAFLGARLAAPRSTRRIMQTWGTEYRRSQNTSYWIDSMHELVKASPSPVVICDGRFVDELQWARANAVQRLHVVRPELTSKVHAHISEQIPAPDENDHVLINREDDLDSLQYQVDTALAGATQCLLDQCRHSRHGRESFAAA